MSEFVKTSISRGVHIVSLYSMVRRFFQYDTLTMLLDILFERRYLGLQMVGGGAMMLSIRKLLSPPLQLACLDGAEPQKSA